MPAKNAAAAAGDAAESPKSLYERDFYSWALAQAALLRAGRFAEIDMANVADELETLGRAEASALGSSYRQIVLHLLKWQYQPGRRAKDWKAAVLRERAHAADVLETSPGLKPRKQELLAKAYQSARKEAAIETDLPMSTFPDACPFTLEQVEDKRL